VLYLARQAGSTKPAPFPRRCLGIRVTITLPTTLFIGLHRVAKK
jgi:hypothetical protein